MSHNLESELRHRLRATVTAFDLAPGAVAMAAEQGRRRLRRTRAITGGGMVLVLAAVGLSAGNMWDRDANKPITVTSEGPAETASDVPPRAPKLLTRDSVADPGLLASLSGTLVATNNDCVAVNSPGAGTVGIIWGRGWSTGTEEGEVIVYDASGAIFAREGERVGLTGGGGGTTDYLASQYSQHPCWADNMFEANNTQGRVPSSAR